MSHLVPFLKKESSTVLGEGYARTTDLDSFIKGYGDPGPGQFFYELEPAEVIKVYLDAEDLINSKQIIDNSEDGEVKPDWSKYGYIESVDSIDGYQTCTIIFLESEVNHFLDDDDQSIENTIKKSVRKNFITNY